MSECPHLGRCKAQGVGGEIRAWCRGPAGKQQPLRVVEGHHQMRSPLSYVPNLKRCRIGELVLDRDIPLIKRSRAEPSNPRLARKLLRSKPYPAEASHDAELPLPTIPSVEVRGREERPGCGGRIDLRPE